MCSETPIADNRASIAQYAPDQIALEQQRLAQWAQAQKGEVEGLALQAVSLSCAYAALARAVQHQRNRPLARLGSAVRLLLRPRHAGLALRWLIGEARRRRFLSPRHLLRALRIQSSGLFDDAYYRRRYPGTTANGEPAVLEFVRRGAAEGRQPHPLFDTQYYLRSNPDINPAIVNPLVHYLACGLFERRRPNAHFDPLNYVAAHPDVLLGDVDPLVHHQQTGGSADEPGVLRDDALRASVDRLGRFASYPSRQPAGPGRAADPAHLELHWIIPGFSRGDGGIMNIFRTIAFLEQFGHRNTIWIQNPFPRQGAAEAACDIRAHFTHLHAAVHLLPEDPVELAGDAVIATDHWTAYAARAVTKVSRRFYFVQDFEPFFYPPGAEYYMTEATYRFGFDCLCNGDWLARIMHEQYGAWTATWQQAYDPRYYHAGDEAARSPDRIAFYARYATPRRAVELAMLAFEVLHRKHGRRFHVDFFGQNIGDLEVPYRYTDRGILSAAELGNLYREAAVGLVFSATNYSISTREMMACGLPVLDLDIESVRAVYPPDVLTLAAPNPAAIAEALDRLLGEVEHRAAQTRAATAYVGQFSWEASARVVERAIRERVVR